MKIVTLNALKNRDASEPLIVVKNGQPEYVIASY